MLILLKWLLFKQVCVFIWCNNYRQGCEHFYLLEGVPLKHFFGLFLTCWTEYDDDVSISTCWNGTCLHRWMFLPVGVSTDDAVSISTCWNGNCSYRWMFLPVEVSTDDAVSISTTGMGTVYTGGSFHLLE